MPEVATERMSTGASSIDLHSRDDILTKTSIYAFGIPLWIAALLIMSGLLHLAILVWEGTDWNGPLSLRKPALFGISGGMTMWSIAWLMTQLRPHRSDRALANLIAMSLFIEVGLITVQNWRGVSSHFNRTTILDASIETLMLALILFATACIFYLTFRTFSLRAIDKSQVIAIRGGMWLLSLSCVLGILTTVLGEINIQNDNPHEYWRRAGVLKFPHGAVLHAIQVLPFSSWLAQRLKVPHPDRLVWFVIVSHLVFLLYSIRQTLTGRDRFDWDTLGGVLLGAIGFLIAYPITRIAVTMAQHIRGLR